MNDRPTNANEAGRVYLALRKKARLEGRSTDELLQMHALEAFVQRLAGSSRAQDFALKGGMLLSAYAVRRPTRDVDLAARGVPNDLGAVESVVAEIAALPHRDGWALTATASETIREDDAYSGVRVTVHGKLSSARQEFHVDVSFGDPIVPAPTVVTLDRVLGGHIEVLGYPLSMVLAEKLITALQRGIANTRWRDYADVFLLSRVHNVRGAELGASLVRVSAARGVTMGALSVVTRDYAERAQNKWSAWVRKQQLHDRLPMELEQLLAGVVAFADPILTSSPNSSEGKVWNATARRWT